MQAMLPTTPYNHHLPPKPHEPINDLPVHRATTFQRFEPVSESAHFDRRDAGKVFDRDLLPADERIPHPQLVEEEKDRYDRTLENSDREKRKAERLAREIATRQAAEEAFLERERRRTTVIKAADEGGEGGRWEWKIRDVKITPVGKGQAGGVGIRYGVPSEERKKGKVKIPTRVE